ncbi:MAG: magnetosome biogenesis CDF transporter MamB [Magnetococcales bacterium]|nr:magnetosome biogenesis CDF transporter MamB [Magnetococcales bacterium]
MKFDHCNQCRDKVIWWALANNIFLACYKGILGGLTGSAALVADAFHSSADVIASTVTMISLKISAKPADEDHAYGHGKIQFISSSIVGLILLIGAFFIMIGAIKDLVRGEYEAPEKIALIGALVSVLCNELMYRYQSCVGHENNSPAILANAWDNRSDAFSSIAVLIGIGFATFGFPIADPLAAFGVSILVIRIGIELNVDAIEGLMDTSPEMEELQVIYDITRGVAGVLGISYLRARSTGEELQVEVSVEVDENLKVYEGDLIVEFLQKKIFDEMEHVGGVQVFLNPVNAEV